MLVSLLVGSHKKGMEMKLDLPLIPNLEEEVDDQWSFSIKWILNGCNYMNVGKLEDPPLYIIKGEEEQERFIDKEAYQIWLRG